VERLGRNTTLDGVAGPVAHAVKKVIRPGAVKDLLSGAWLGHPLHPVLTDIPIGAFTSATVLDVIGGRRSRDAADVLIGLGLLAAVPTAAAGASDWSETYGDAQRVGVVHAATNLVGVGLFACSLAARRRGARVPGKLLSLAGLGALSVGAYLGGYLTYTRGVGVNHAFHEEPPADWIAVLDDTELPADQPTEAKADGATVVLYRSGDRIHAIGGICSHAGGPLAEGTVDETSCSVTCPWHGSVFRLTDGTVVHGPATVPQTAYDVRVEGGSVEVRRRQ
jgi:nitrite reductase/ring-hydroxylating ferredoxin subunit/uncharacterized membrane protein